MFPVGREGVDVFWGATPLLSGNEARRRQMNDDHRLHLGDARDGFDEPQTQGVKLRNTPYRTTGY